MAATLNAQASTAATRRPAVRVLPIPRLEPPTDDELRAAGIEPPPTNAPLLPLDLPGAFPRRRAGQRARIHPGQIHPGQIHPGPIHPRQEYADQPGIDHAQPTARDELSTGMSPLEAWVAARHATELPPSPCRGAMMRFLAVVFEVAGGFRPVTQLRGLCRPDRFDDICGQITGRHPTIAGRLIRSGGFVPCGAIVRGKRTPAAGRTPSGAPPRAGRIDSRGPAAKITVRRLHICDVSTSAAEVSVVLARGPLVWAVAARMELISDRWLCAHLEIL